MNILILTCYYGIIQTPIKFEAFQDEPFRKQIVNSSKTYYYKIHDTSNLNEITDYVSIMDNVRGHELTYPLRCTSKREE